jgi:glycerol-3-phosphate acyltransferase PlsY
MVVPGVIAVIVAYLLGAIPTAYIVTRLLTGRDIRGLGGGNVGARNVFREVGIWPGVGVALFDVGKGVAAVIVAYRLLNEPLYEPQFFGLFSVPTFFILGAGVAVVVGHIWSIYLKFTGGNGLATTLGVLTVLLWRELLIALALTVILIVVIRNVVLSVNISLLFSVPVSAWFLEGSWLPVIFSLALVIVLIINFFPKARAASIKAGSKENLFTELFRTRKAKKRA